MMTKYFKRKKGKDLTPATPRTIDDIKKEYQELAARAANAQYQIFIYGEELKQLNMRQLQVNQEAAARQKLDTEAAKLEPTKSTGEQNAESQRA